MYSFLLLLDMYINHPLILNRWSRFFVFRFGSSQSLNVDCGRWNVTDWWCEVAIFLPGPVDPPPLPIHHSARCLVRVCGPAPGDTALLQSRFMGIKIWRESAEQWSSGAQSAGVIYQVLAVISIISIVSHTQSGLNITKYSLEDPPRPGQYGPVMSQQIFLPD